MSQVANSVLSEEAVLGFDYGTEVCTLSIESWATLRCWIPFFFVKEWASKAHEDSWFGRRSLGIFSRERRLSLTLTSLPVKVSCPIPSFRMFSICTFREMRMASHFLRFVFKFLNCSKVAGAKWSGHVVTPWYVRIQGPLWNYCHPLGVLDTGRNQQFCS